MKALQGYEYQSGGDGGKQSHLIKLAAAYYAGMDGPQQIDHIHRILDGGPVTDYGKRADGSESDHDTGLKTQDDGRYEKGHYSYAYIEGAVIEGAVGNQPVNRKFIGA